MKIYNVLTRKKEEFIPLTEGFVKMYACGITASGDAHVGHALQAVVFDMIRRYLTFRGYTVTYVRNYTDVDDKIILRAAAEGVDPISYARRLMKKTDEELDALLIQRPTIESRVTDCITDIIDFIQTLINKGYAYQSPGGDVFYRVASFPTYGNFSNRDAEQAQNNVRIESNTNKQDERDFALWKAAKEGEISWDSPWGAGRPGWHIECSAMSIKYLGETLDIHGGGKDLIFPHHENEIAQSEAATGKLFAKYWIHNGLIKVDGQKMSKSLNNGILLEDLLREYDPETIRMALLHNHYSSDMNITEGMFEVFEKHVYNMYRVFAQIDRVASALHIDKEEPVDLKVAQLEMATPGKIAQSECTEPTPNEQDPVYQEIMQRFITVMDNDFNTSLAISDLQGYVSDLYQLLASKRYEEAAKRKAALQAVYGTIGFCSLEPESVLHSMIAKYLARVGITEEEINNLLNERTLAKKAKEFARADEIRQILLQKSIEVKDTREGVVWDLMFGGGTA